MGRKKLINKEIKIMGRGAQSTQQQGQKQGQQERNRPALKSS